MGTGLQFAQAKANVSIGFTDNKVFRRGEFWKLSLPQLFGVLFWNVVGHKFNLQNQILGAWLCEMMSLPRRFSQLLFGLRR